MAADPAATPRAALPSFLHRAYCAGRPFGGSGGASAEDDNNNTDSLCATDAFACGGRDTTGDQDDDIRAAAAEDSSIMAVQQQEQQQSKQEEPPTQQRVRNLVDGILSPFMSCVQPPLQACAAPVAEWRAPTRQHLRAFGGRMNCATGACADGTSSSSNAAAARGGETTIIDHNSTDVFSGLSESALAVAPSSSSSPTTRTTPRDNDILCGRGNNSNRHQGNQQFRDLIAANKSIYGTLTKKEKMLLARQIVDLILNHTDPPARFLGRDTTTGLWYDIGIPRSLEKTSQALREKTAAVRAAEKQQQAAGAADHQQSAGGSDVGSTVAESDVFSNISETSHAAEGNNSSKNNNKTSKPRNRPVEPPPVKIPGHLREVFGHHHRKPMQREPQPLQLQQQQMRRDYQHTLAARNRASPTVYAPPPPPLPVSTRSHPRHHQYSGPGAPPPPPRRPTHHPSIRVSEPSRQRSMPTYDYGPFDEYRTTTEYPFDERRPPPPPRRPPYHADPRFAPPPPPPPPPVSSPQFERTTRSVPATPPMVLGPQNHHKHAEQQLQRQYQHRSAAIVTPQHPNSRPRNDSYDQQQRFYEHQQQRRHPHLESSSGVYTTPQQQMRVRSVPQPVVTLTTPTRRGGTPRAPAVEVPFPENVWHNPEWSSPPPKTPEHERPAVETKTPPHQVASNATASGKPTSPTLEQEWKRQRVSSIRRVDVSSSSNETSMETQNLNTSSSSNETTNNNAGKNNNTSGTSSAGLITEAIETQLTLEERVITSPSALNQSYASRRRRSYEGALPRPPKMSSDLNVSADSMDGMAALATAAFLRLDETDD